MGGCCCSGSPSTPAVDYPGHVKLVVYDFDLTISEEHLYSVLMGVQDPSALHKLGKERLIRVFGGNERLGKLKEHFSRLEGQCELTIISFGYTAIIRESLRMVDIDPSRTFSKIVGRDSNTLSKVGLQKWKLIQQWRIQRHLSKEQVCFVDDDSNNVQMALEHGVCQCVDILERRGMNDEHFQKVEDLVFGRRNETTTVEDNSADDGALETLSQNGSAMNIVEMRDPSLSFSSASQRVSASHTQE